MSAKVVLVTGASSGVGQATARRLAGRGWSVWGTARDPARAEPIPGVEMIALDVREDDSVAACVAAVLARSGRIDALVNNAGYELAGALEETSLGEAKAQFETNFFGVLRMVNAVVPAMREAGAGRIVNVTSLSGVAPIPFMGLYSATKSALEIYGEALRHELMPFGVHVSHIAPGFLNTPMIRNRQAAARRISAYDRWRERALQSVRAFEDQGPPAELVAEAVAGVLASPKPALRHFVGSQARLVSKLRRFLPAAAFESGMRRNFRLDG
jgi:NAD(P)-dependent dehydrogenase (short-subunit alcohol dehydrogenase family)